MFAKIFGSLIALIVAQLLQTSTAQEGFFSGLRKSNSEGRVIQIPGDVRSEFQGKVPIDIPNVPLVSVTPVPTGIATIFPRQQVKPPSLENDLVSENPVTGNVLTVFRDHVTELGNDPLRALGAIVEKVTSRFRQNVGTASGVNQSPISFLNYFDNLEKVIDDSSDDETCMPIFTTLDHSIYTTQQVLHALQALSKLGNSWKVMDIQGVVGCFAKRGLLQNQDEN